MRRAVGVVVAVVLIGLLSSCSLLPAPFGQSRDPDIHAAETEAHRIAEAVKDQDATALKKVFSPRARENTTNLDAGVRYFLSVFPSGWTSWKGISPASETDTWGHKEATAVSATYKVSANGRKYNVFFFDLRTNDFHPDSVGIWALGAAPWTSDPDTASGAKKPFYVWGGQFGIDETTRAPVGNPGVYMPRS